MNRIKLAAQEFQGARQNWKSHTAVYSPYQECPPTARTHALHRRRRVEPPNDESVALAQFLGSYTSFRSSQMPIGCLKSPLNGVRYWPLLCCIRMPLYCRVRVLKIVVNGLHERGWSAELPARNSPMTRQPMVTWLNQIVEKHFSGNGLPPLNQGSYFLRSNLVVTLYSLFWFYCVLLVSPVQAIYHFNIVHSVVTEPYSTGTMPEIQVALALDQCVEIETQMSTLTNKPTVNDAYL